MISEKYSHAAELAYALNVKLREIARLSPIDGGHLVSEIKRMAEMETLPVCTGQCAEVRNLPAPTISMRVLIACEYSGTVRDAFIARGHDAMSCDLLPTDKPGPHYQGDVFDIIGDGFDLMIAHPPCTYLSVSGMHWTTRGLRDPQLTDDALDFVRRLLGAPIDRIALENPVSIISSKIRKPDQIIQPWQFGHDASKKTCLWLKNLPMLMPTRTIEPRIINGRARYGNQTDSGQNRLGPSDNRWKLRSETYTGIAEAMADQWGKL